MKRLIALFLSLILLSASLGTLSLAEEFTYTDDDIEELYYDFEYVSGFVETMFGSDEGIAYWKYVSDMDEKSLASRLIGFSNKIIGEEPDKKYYTELLVNMIATFEYDMASQIENQGQFDNMKNVKEYALDLVDIGATVIGLEGKAEHIEKAIGVAADALELTLDTVGELKYYELTIKNYAKADSFLRAVKNYSDNEEMKEAADGLMRANELLFNSRVECIADNAENMTVFAAKNYLSDLSFALLKNIDEYKTDSVVKDYVDFGEKAYGALDTLVSTGKAVFKTVMMGGDLLFGTTNTFRRHNEMKAMADIAEALVKAYEDIEVSKDDGARKIYSNIRMKCDYYKMLIATHLRGEYLIYSLNYNDAGVLSSISRWSDNYVKEEDKTIQKWYDAQVKYCEEYYEKVEGIFDSLLKEKFVVHEGFELHDGFIVEIEKKETVPEGYIGVYTFDDFKKIADSCPSDAFVTSIYNQETEFNTAKYILMNDIVFPAEFDSAGAFYGVIDGNGYTMKNVTKTLFECIGDATVRNLGIEVNYVVDLEDNESSFGVISPAINGFNNEDGVFIDNCFVKGTIDVSCRSGYFGAFIGYADGATITNSYNEANISIRTRQSGSAGGITGRYAEVTNSFNSGNISLYASCANTFNVYSINVDAGGIKAYNYSDDTRNCYNTGTITASAAGECHVYAGGIIGYNYGSYYAADAENCYNLGRVTADWTADYDTEKEYGHALGASYAAGGIIGRANDGTVVSRCFNGGDVSGEHFGGGIVGFSNSDSNESIVNSYNLGNITAVQYAGGILGRDFWTAGIKKSYNMGIVSGAINNGAIAGSLVSGEESLSGVYYLDGGTPATSAGIEYSGVKALTAEEMAKPESFEEYDFIEIWKLRDDDVRPELKR